MAGYNEDVNINLNILAGAMGGITAIAGGMSALTSTFGQFGTTAVDAFGDVDGLLVSASALIAAFGVEAANAYGEFEQGMKIVQAVSGQTSGAIAQLSEQANQLSVSYRTAIGDITEGLQTLGRAGLNSADTQLEVLESGLQTAKLEGRNLNGVLEELIQNTAMLGGNLDSIDFGAQTEYINSLMVGTSMSAPIDTHDISQTLQYVGGTAAAAGANLEDKEKLEDLMGTIAAFAQKGVTGSMAGTALRAFLTKPASQDKTVTEGLGAIGLSPEDLWEDGGESMKDISDQIELIQHQMDKLNLSTMDQLEIWGKIVGPKMGQQMMKLDADKIDELKSNIQEASSAEELATSTLNTYTQKVNEMGQIGSGIFRQLGSNIVMWLNPVLEVINKILSLLNNPIGGIAIFSGMIAILSRGIQAAYGMITTVVGQVRTAIREIQLGIQSLSSPMSQATSHASAFKTQIDAIIGSVMTLNTNIANTDTLSGAMQARLLGKTATAQLRGFEGTKTLPSNVFALSDSYTQYFKKPVTNQDYATYKAPISINSGIYNLLREEEKKMFESKSRGGFYTPKKGYITPDKYENLSPILKQRYEKEVIDENEYQKLSKSRKKLYEASGDRYTTDLGHQHIRTGAYNALSPDQQKEYYGQNYRLMGRIGTIQELDRETKAAAAQLRTFTGTTQQWKALSQEERDNHIAQTKELRRNALRDMRANKVGGEVDPLTGQRMYGYTTVHNIPLKETLNKKLAREAYEAVKPMSEARKQELSAGFTRGSREAMGHWGRMKDDGLKKLNNTANTLNKSFSSLGSAATTVSNTIRSVPSKVSQSVSGFTQSVKQAGGPLAYFKNGLSQLTGQTQLSATAQSLSNAQIEQQIVSLASLQGGEMTVSGLLEKLAADLGIEAQEMAKLIMASKELQAKFTQLATQKTGATPEQVGAVVTQTAGKMGRLGGVISGVIGQMGGPFSVAIMGATIAIQALQAAFQSYQKKLQDADKQLSEASEKRKEYESSIKDIYTSENENLTEADIERAILAQYGSIGNFETGDGLDSYGSAYVNGDLIYQVGKDEDVTSRIGDEKDIKEFTLAQDDNIKALNENTIALAAATQEYARAAQKKSDTLSDGFYGMEGWATEFTDLENNPSVEGYIMDFITGGFGDIYHIMQGPEERKSFFDTGNPNLTRSQKSDDYGGSKELAAIMAADAKRFGVEGGLTNAFGTDINEIIRTLGGIESNTYQSLKTHMDNMASMDAETAAAAQVSLKENKQDYQRIGKLMAKWENTRGKVGDMTSLEGKTSGAGLKGLRLLSRPTAYDAAMQRANARKSGKQQDPNTKIEQKELAQLKSIERSIDNEVAKMIRLSNNKLTEANVLAMSQLQQFQDMYDVANSIIAPGVINTAQQAYQNVIATNGAAMNAGEAGSGAKAAAQNAEIIAAFLVQKSIAESGKMMYEGEVASGNWVAGVLGESTYKSFVASDWGKIFASHQRDVWGQTQGYMVAKYQHPDYSPTELKEMGDAKWEATKQLMDKNGTNLNTGLTTMSRPMEGVLSGQVLAAYLNSDVGEFGSNKNPSGSGGGGGGGGSGDGSGDSDKGNKKNRVDLVLCNKKEIPKLNVNLFKKEPNFTVLNKNFKLRDIKINTKDTPKSILTAVKNGLIDTAKRMDPKIIQDEEGEYDPTGATEGKDTPSGTTPSSSE